MDRGEVSLQAPLLADTMRKIVDAILDGREYVKLSTYKKKKGKESRREKKFPLPKIEWLSHKERKELAKEAFHEALTFRNIDLKHDRITAACREIQWEYKKDEIYSEKKLWWDAKTLVWAYFLFRKVDGKRGLLSTFKTITKHPSTWAFDGSSLLSTLKTLLQSVERNKEIDYKKFTKRLEEYTLGLLKEYGEKNEKK